VPRPWRPTHQGREIRITATVQRGYYAGQDSRWHIGGDVTKDELKLWRWRMCLTQAKAAKALGVPLHTYCNWEAGRTKVVPRPIGVLTSMIEISGAAPGLPAPGQVRTRSTERPPEEDEKCLAL
jgi:DNA-binding transcriptional regulator YiaG